MPFKILVSSSDVSSSAVISIASESSFIERSDFFLDTFLSIIEVDLISNELIGWNNFIKNTSGLVIKFANFSAF